MKTKSKALLLSLCAVLLVAATVLGTIAWLTAQDSVTNTFTVGNVKIELKEPETDKFGEHYYQKADGGVSGEEKTEVEIPDSSSLRSNWDKYVIVDKNDYTLRPGQEYAKEPHIILDDNSENCYYFVKIDNQLKGIECETFREGDDFYTTIEEQMKILGWAKVEGYTGVYALHYVEMKPESDEDELSPERRVVGTERDSSTGGLLDGDKYVPVFTCFRVKDDVDGDTLKSLTGKTITITAYAVQADGLNAVTEEGTNVVSDAELWATAFPEAAESTKITTPEPAEPTT